MDYFIKKNNQRRIPKNYFLLIQRLHKDVYVDSMKKSNKIIMKRPVIRTKFLELTPQEMFFYLYPKEDLLQTV